MEYTTQIIKNLNPDNLRRIYEKINYRRKKEKHGTLSQIAKEVGVSRSTIFERLEEYGIRRNTKRS
jgi:DNA-binding MurR/RpiR family transcriptional regulator